MTMQQALRASLVVWFLTPTLCARDEPQHKLRTPQERYRALLREHQTAMRQFWAKYQNFKTQEEQRKFFKEQFPQPQPYIRRFLELAESAPQDAAAVDALIWIVRNGGFDPEVSRASERLATNHAGNKRLGEIAPRLVPNLVYSLSPSADNLLRAIIAKNPDRVVQGQACMALAEYLKRESELVRALKGDTEQARQLRSYYLTQGADEASFQYVRSMNPDALAKRSEAMFSQAAKDYADVSDFLRIVDMGAQAKLFQNPNLGIGKPAPEIAGHDIDGNPFKLSDYKGRVVVLLFWGDWCGPSRAMYSHAHSLVKRLERKPFALLGINSDKDKEKLRQRINNENINWRSWWDGGGEHGPIAAEYNIPGWPTMYILDHDGVIRHKFLGPPDDELFDIDKVIDELTTTATAIEGAPSSTPISK
jgi:thiol-disulfide isomerase/thioredoxin